jgi:hypothetical protein
MVLQIGIRWFPFVKLVAANERKFAGAFVTVKNMIKLLPEELS